MLESEKSVKNLKVIDIVAAIQFTNKNKIECMRFTNDIAYALSEKDENRVNKLWFLIIPTPQGNMRVDYGDYIVKDIKGDFYPCKQNIYNVIFGGACTAAGEQK